MYHRIIQINHQPDATIFQFIILTFIYSSTCFGRFPAHHQELSDCSGSLWFYLRIVVIAVLCSWSGRPARPRTQHECHHDTKIKPEAATAVNELLMMGGKTPETRRAVNKRQDNKMENCCIWLVIYLNCAVGIYYPIRGEETSSYFSYCSWPGYAVVHLVQALYYSRKCPGFDSRWCHWNFSLI